MGELFIADLIMKHAAETPGKIAVADKINQLTYSELQNRMFAVAAFLVEKNIQKGDVVCVRAAQNVEFAACLFGAQYVGAIVCPVEKSATRERTEEILRQVSGKCLLDVTDTVIPGVDVYQITDAYNHQYSGAVVVPERLPEDISDIIFTTGTTGKSKGILVSNAANIAIAENVIDSVAMTENEVEMITSPTSHSLALRRTYAAMYIGSTVVYAENFLLYNNFFGLFTKYGVTAITFVPAILNLILEAYKDMLGEFDNQLNYIQLGSAPLHESVKERLVKLLPTTRLYNTYGATESGCTIILEFSKYGDKAGCIGRTTVNTELFFTDESRQNRVEACDSSSAGYLAFAGGMNMSGYINDPVQTAEVLQNGIIYTNDIGYRGEDGLVYLLGRVGEVINCGGLKINPVEIEEVALKMYGIKDCACVPMKDKRLGEAPKLFVVYEQGKETEITNKMIKDYIRQFLEDYKVPTAIEAIDEIPRTFNGKIRRKELINR